MFSLLIIILVTTEGLGRLTQGKHHHENDLILPYRPVASKRVSKVNFITKVLTLKKEYNLRAHEKHFKDIIKLWTALFMEHQLMENEGIAIELTNPECRDLRAIVIDALKSVSELLDANLNIKNIRKYRSVDSKRNNESTTIKNLSPDNVYFKSPTVTIRVLSKKIKRSFITKTALSLVGSYLAKQVLKGDDGLSNDGLIPFGGNVLAMAFGIARRREVELNKRKLSLLSNQFINLQSNQGKLIKFANITKLVLGEMADLISRNDARITNLFNETTKESKKNRRGIICLKLYSESIYMIDAVKTSINNFIMADTLLPKGNKNLFSEAELRNLLLSQPDHLLATGDQNFWDYSLFSIRKTGNQWAYEIQVPLTNLPTFTIYRVSPFPVFPLNNNGSAYIVDIPEDNTVILSNDDKYFIDKVYTERCTYSNNHGICPGPVGLIDTDLCNCKVSLMLFETTRMHKLCKFKIYTGYTPRIATSMGKFIISSNDKHDFIQSCINNSRSHITTQPGTTMISIHTGCTLNTTDIKLLNPIDAITNQKLNLDIEPIFRFQKKINIGQESITPEENTILRNRLRDLEERHIGDTGFNEHLEANSLTYTITIVVSITLLGIAIILLYFKIKLIIPVINIMRKYWTPKNSPKSNKAVDL